MASPEADVSLGYSLGTNGTNNAWAVGLKIFDVTPPADEVEDILTSHQGLTQGNHNTYLPADIGENTELTLVIYFQADTLPTVGFTNATLEIFTLTYPDAETNVFSGYVKSHTPDTHAFNERMMATVVIKVSGEIT